MQREQSKQSPAFQTQTANCNKWSCSPTCSGSTCTPVLGINQSFCIPRHMLTSLAPHSLCGGTRILLLMAHQPMGWISTVPKLHQKSWPASFSKPSYRRRALYPARTEETTKVIRGQEFGTTGLVATAWPSELRTGYQSFSSNYSSKLPSNQKRNHMLVSSHSPTMVFPAPKSLSSCRVQRAAVLLDQLPSALWSFPQGLDVPSCQRLLWRLTYNLDDRCNPVHTAGEHSITVQHFHFHSFHHIIPLIEERHLKDWGSHVGRGMWESEQGSGPSSFQRHVLGSYTFTLNTGLHALHLLVLPTPWNSLTVPNISLGCSLMIPKGRIPYSNTWLFHYQMSYYSKVAANIPL